MGMAYDSSCVSSIGSINVCEGSIGAVRSLVESYTHLLHVGVQYIQMKDAIVDVASQSVLNCCQLSSYIHDRTTGDLNLGEYGHFF